MKKMKIFRMKIILINPLREIITSVKFWSFNEKKSFFWVSQVLVSFSWEWLKNFFFYKNEQKFWSRTFDLSLQRLLSNIFFLIWFFFSINVMTWQHKIFLIWHGINAIDWFFLTELQQNLASLETNN